MFASRQTVNPPILNERSLIRRDVRETFDKSRVFVRVATNYGNQNAGVVWTISSVRPGDEKTVFIVRRRRALTHPVDRSRGVR